jgi:DNA-binding response OmpR family regulator
VANILIVEDETAIARLLALVARNADHSVRVALTLGDGTAEIASGWPDVVTLDLKLGLDDGRDLLVYARDTGFRGKFIIVSAYGAQQVAAEFGIDWVSKPFDPSVLLEKIEELVADLDQTTPTETTA